MQQPREHQLNVLVIDDDEDMRDLLVDIVTRYDHQAVSAASAEEALALLPYWTFHVAFLDHKLPGLEGLLLGEYLRRHNADLTIALVTGHDDPKLERRSRDLAIRFISKPFQVAEIVAVIEGHQAEAKEREDRRCKQEDPNHSPPIAEHAAELTACYGIPSVPARIEDRLVETIKRCLRDLRTCNRYTERDRVVALAGLLTARVLGVTLPKTPRGMTLFEEYDRVMVENGRRVEFSGVLRPSPSSPSSPNTEDDGVV